MWKVYRGRREKENLVRANREILEGKEWMEKSGRVKRKNGKRERRKREDGYRNERTIRK